MKIAILTSGILPVPAVQGGAVENLIDFYLEYNNVQQLHDITIYSAYHPAVKKHQALKSYSNHYKYIKTNTIWFKILRRLYHRYCPKGYYHSSIELYFELIYRQIRKQSYDLIILENRPAFALKLKERLPKTPIITHLHTNMVHSNNPKAMDIICSTNAFITVSKYLKKQIEDVGVPTNIAVVYNGIDTTIFNTTVSPIDRQTLGFNDKDFIVIFTGRLIKDKGIKELLLAIKEIIVKDIKEKVVFTGYIPYKKIPSYLATANVIVVPSHINEAFGMVCIEACAMGLPVIATNEGGIPEALTGQNHILIDISPDLPTSIANAIIEIKNNRKKYLGNSLKNIFKKETYAKSFFSNLTNCVTDYAK